MTTIPSIMQNMLIELSRAEYYDIRDWLKSLGYKEGEDFINPFQEGQGEKWFPEVIHE